MIPLPFVLLGAAGAVVAYQIWRESHFEWKVREVKVRAITDQYEIRIEPDFQERLIGNPVPNGIRLVVENKTNDDLIVDWANTLYVANGNTDGHFIFYGRQVGPQISAPRAADVIFPQRWLTKVVKPVVKVREQQIPVPMSGRYGGFMSGRSFWTSPPLEAGSHGIYLTLRFNGETIKETLEFELDHQRRNQAPTETQPQG